MELGQALGVCLCDTRVTTYIVKMVTGRRVGVVSMSPNQGLWGKLFSWIPAYEKLLKKARAPVLSTTHGRCVGGHLSFRVTPSSLQVNSWELLDNGRQRRFLLKCKQTFIAQSSSWGLRIEFYTGHSFPAWAWPHQTVSAMGVMENLALTQFLSAESDPS